MLVAKKHSSLLDAFKNSILEEVIIKLLFFVKKMKIGKDPMTTNLIVKLSMLNGHMKSP